MKLSELKVGESAIIKEVGGKGALRQHFLDMGLVQGVEVMLLKLAPLGDPMELLVRGYTLSLRLEDASKILIVPKNSYCREETADSKTDFGYNLSLHEHNSHPGLGEAGKYHDPDHESPFPKDTLLTFALVGQQNSGKTTLFN